MGWLIAREQTRFFFQHFPRSTAPFSLSVFSVTSLTVNRLLPPPLSLSLYHSLRSPMCLNE